MSYAIKHNVEDWVRPLVEQQQIFEAMINEGTSQECSFCTDDVGASIWHPSSEFEIGVIRGNKYLKCRSEWASIERSDESLPIKEIICPYCLMPYMVGEIKDGECKACELKILDSECGDSEVGE